MLIHTRKKKRVHLKFNFSCKWPCITYSSLHLKTPQSLFLLSPPTYKYCDHGAAENLKHSWHVTSTCSAVEKYPLFCLWNKNWKHCSCPGFPRMRNQKNTVQGQGAEDRLPDKPSARCQTACQPQGLNGTQLWRSHKSWKRLWAAGHCEMKQKADPSTYQQN